MVVGWAGGPSGQTPGETVQTPGEIESQLQAADRQRLMRLSLRIVPRGTLEPYRFSIWDIGTAY